MVFWNFISHAGVFLRWFCIFNYRYKECNTLLTNKSLKWSIQLTLLRCNSLLAGLENPWIEPLNPCTEYEKIFDHNFQFFENGRIFFSGQKKQKISKKIMKTVKTCKTGKRANKTKKAKNVKKVHLHAKSCSIPWLPGLKKSFELKKIAKCLGLFFQFAFRALKRVSNASSTIHAP